MPDRDDPSEVPVGRAGADRKRARPADEPVGRRDDREAGRTGEVEPGKKLSLLRQARNRPTEGVRRHERRFRNGRNRRALSRPLRIRGFDFLEFSQHAAQELELRFGCREPPGIRSAGIRKRRGGPGERGLVVKESDASEQIAIRREAGGRLPKRRSRELQRLLPPLVERDDFGLHLAAPPSHEHGGKQQRKRAENGREKQEKRRGELLARRRELQGKNGSLPGGGVILNLQGSEKT